MNVNREHLIGRWYRHDMDESGNQLVEYCQFAIDGSFEFCFISLSSDDEVIEQTIELGDWGLVANIHFTMTKSEIIDDEVYAADLSNSDNYHAYQVLALEHDYFEYQHIITEERFILKRVVDNIGHC